MASSVAALSATELISKGIAPVLREYWKPVEARQEVAAVTSSRAPAQAIEASNKKTKRQFKRVRMYFFCTFDHL